MLPSLDHALCLASSPPDQAAFSIAGASCHACGMEPLGIVEIRMDGRTVVEQCRIIDAECTRFQVTPLGVERHLRVRDIDVVEKTVVAPFENALAIEWASEQAVELALVARTSVDDIAINVSHEWDGEHLALAAGQPARLVVAASASNADPEAWVRTHRATAALRAAEWLRAELPGDRLSAALEWAEFRLDAQRPATVAALRARIGVGDFRNVGAVLASGSASHDVLPIIAELFAAAGDSTFAQAHWRGIAAGIDACAGKLGPATLRGLAQLAEAIGEASSASDLLHAARGRGDEATPWTDFDAGLTRHAAQQWCADAEACFYDEKGAWPRAAGRSAEDFIAALAFGMLGFVPDAVRGRLRLRPQIPEEWQFANIRNIRMGDALVSMEYSRVQEGWRFDLKQYGGAYPVRLVFEPALPRVPSRARVDGHAADLAFAPFGERIIAPVQIVLDDTRCIEIE